MAGARPLSITQEVALLVAVEFADDTRDRCVLADRPTLQALVRRGLADDVRREGDCWIATLTDDGLQTARRIADERNVEREAERIVRDASPEGQLAQRWEQSIGGCGAHARIGKDGTVRLTLSLRFKNEEVSERFRLDMMNVMLTYKRHGPHTEE